MELCGLALGYVVGVFLFLYVVLATGDRNIPNQIKKLMKQMDKH